MSTGLEEPAAAAEVKSPVARLNPGLRGPILLATDGAGKSGAAVITARLLANHLQLPLEVVTVLEPQVAYSATLGDMPVALALRHGGGHTLVLIGS